MSFLALVIALILLEVRGNDASPGPDAWLGQLYSTLRSVGLPSEAAVVLCVILPVVGAGIVLGVLQPILFGLFWIAAAVAVLLYSFGRGDFRALVARYQGWCRQENYESAWLEMSRSMPLEPESAQSGPPPGLPLQIQGHILYQGYQRWFAVLLYFVVFGPGGALAYRLLQLARALPGGAFAQRLLDYADWVPVRLLAGTFALMGDFMGSREELFRSGGASSTAGTRVLLATARAALGMDREAGAEQLSGERAARQLAEIEALLSRSGVAWMVVLSLAVVVF